MSRNPIILERKRSEWREKPCPQCGAESGERCKGVNGYRQSVHRARRFAATRSAPFSPPPQPSSLLPPNQRLEQYIYETMIHVEGLLRAQIEMFSKRSESPIEELFAAAVILHRNGSSVLGVELMPFGSSFDRERRVSPFDCTDVFSQAQIGAYRVDFIFDDLFEGKRRFIVVELDGHEWHERTKQQAARDKKRDRALVSAGYRILRFTGSEAYADPGECLTEVVDAILSARRED